VANSLIVARLDRKRLTTKEASESNDLIIMPAHGCEAAHAASNSAYDPWLSVKGTISLA
jgi:hypothetical protein